MILIKKMVITSIYMFFCLLVYFVVGFSFGEFSAYIALCVLILMYIFLAHNNTVLNLQYPTDTNSLEKTSYWTNRKYIIIIMLAYILILWLLTFLPVLILKSILFIIIFFVIDFLIWRNKLSKLLK